MNDRFEQVCAAFAAIDREDPRIVDRGRTVSERYHATLAGWIAHLAPNASEAVRLAARCQHIRRWSLPRGRFADGGAGYKRWRSTLARMHANEASRILNDAGYATAITTRVQELLLKKDLAGDAGDEEVQILEDAICLVFIETELVDFAAKHADEKVEDILRKTWAKMSTPGRVAAMALVASLPARVWMIVARATE